MQFDAKFVRSLQRLLRRRLNVALPPALRASSNSRTVAAAAEPARRGSSVATERVRVRCSPTGHHAIRVATPAMRVSIRAIVQLCKSFVLTFGNAFPRRSPDVRSLGCVTWTAVTARKLLPYRGNDAGHTYGRVCRGPSGADETLGKVLAVQIIAEYGIVVAIDLLGRGLWQTKSQIQR